MSSVNGYGTAGPGATNGPARQRAGYNATDEEQPLLNGVGTAQTGNSKSLTSRLRKSAAAEVKRDWADVVLIFCYIITGMLDSSAISDWGSFVSMQTGKLFMSPTPHNIHHLLTHSRSHNLTTRFERECTITNPQTQATPST